MLVAGVKGIQVFACRMTWVNRLINRVMHARALSFGTDSAFRAFIEQLPVGTCLIDSRQQRVLYANRAACELLGHSSEAMGRLKARAIFADGDSPLAGWLFKGGKLSHAVRGERSLKRRNGSVFPAEVIVRRLGDRKLLVLFFDISGHKNREKQLQDELDASHGLLRSLPGLFYLFDRKGRLLHWNRNFEEVSGYTSEELARAHPLDFIPEDEKAFVAEQIREAFLTGGAGTEFHILTKNKTRIPFLFVTETISTPGVGDCLAAVGMDISARKTLEEQVYRQAHYDALTNLPNRSLFFDRFSRALTFAHRYGRQLAVLFVDLDFFKEVNDTLGHDAGDLVLKQAALGIASCLRESDTVARVGGDEFLVLLPEVSGAEEACIVADKILTALSLPIDVAGFRVSISSSIGVAIFPFHGSDEDDLVKAADEAMYQAKRAGKNRYRLNAVTARLNCA
jgi:diguanylate cyclase (GGDEF)-like protein/PAS domain S-box-containing protein